MSGEKISKVLIFDSYIYFVNQDHNVDKWTRESPVEHAHEKLRFYPSQNKEHIFEQTKVLQFVDEEPNNMDQGESIFASAYQIENLLK